MPLNKKGKKIMGAMMGTYGSKKGKNVFYAMENSGKLKGIAGGEKLAGVIPPFDAGGGRSDAENRMVGHMGKVSYGTGSPKDTSGGKDLGKNAKNVVKGPAGLLTKEQGPTAWPQSRNKGTNYKSGEPD